MNLLDFRDDDAEYVDTLRKEFRKAEPFPHVVLRDVIRVPIDDVLRDFPALDWYGWSVFEDSYQREKRYCGDLELISPLAREMIYELSRPRFLRFLGSVSEIDALIPDPYLEGGGLHCTGPGGRLVPHTDFHAYHRLNLFRQLNVLLYLNPDWRASFGGELQLFRKGTDGPLVSVEPGFGTCVIFKTDHVSVHGVNPLSADADPRRSIATYYYTSQHNREFSGDNVTYWQEHDAGSLTRSQRTQLQLSRALTFMARGISYTAHHMNPILRNAGGTQK